MRLSRNAAALSLSFAAALTGCATTGQQWVSQPESGVWAAHSPSEDIDTPLLGGTHADVTRQAVEANPTAARPRLDHVVSLGEVDASEAALPASAPATARDPTIIVNIVNAPQATPAYGYGYARSARASGTLTSRAVTRVAPGPSTRTGEIHVGRPSYGGPNFPFHSAPASAWERPR